MKNGWKGLSMKCLKFISMGVRCFIFPLSSYYLWMNIINGVRSQHQLYASVAFINHDNADNPCSGELSDQVKGLSLELRG